MATDRTLVLATALAEARVIADEVRVRISDRALSSIVVYHLRSGRDRDALRLAIKDYADDGGGPSRLGHRDPVANAAVDRVMREQRYRR